MHHDTASGITYDIFPKQTGGIEKVGAVCNRTIRDVPRLVQL